MFTSRSRCRFRSSGSRSTANARKRTDCNRAELTNNSRYSSAEAYSQNSVRDSARWICYCDCRQSGEILYGRVPSGSVVVPGSMPSGDGRVSLYCAVIVKRVDAQTRAKTAINDLLRGD